MSNESNSFASFLTAEDRFKLQFEQYFPDFMQHLYNDTLGKDEEFTQRTIALQELGREAGIELEEYIQNYVKENGYK